MRANLDAFRAGGLRPRMLAGNDVRDMSVEVLGLRSPAPFLLAPVGVLSIAHEEAEVGVAQRRRLVRRADDRSRAPRPTRMEEVAETGAPRWFQLYWVRTARSARASSSAPRTRATARSSSRSTR